MLMSSIYAWRFHTACLEDIVKMYPSSSHSIFALTTSLSTICGVLASAACARLSTIVNVPFALGVTQVEFAPHDSTGRTCLRKEASARPDIMMQSSITANPLNKVSRAGELFNLSKAETRRHHLKYFFTMPLKGGRIGCEGMMRWQKGEKRGPVCRLTCGKWCYHWNVCMGRFCSIHYSALPMFLLDSYVVFGTRKRLVLSSAPFLVRV